MQLKKAKFADDKEASEERDSITILDNNKRNSAVSLSKVNIVSLHSSSHQNFTNNNKQRSVANLNIKK